ncbi:unnamed protein product, partial [Rotaria sp. Silwood1]
MTTSCGSYYSSNCYSSTAISVGAIIGIVIGCLAGVALIVGIIITICVLCKKRPQIHAPQLQMQQQMQPQMQQQMQQQSQQQYMGPMNFGFGGAQPYPQNMNYPPPGYAP